MHNIISMNFFVIWSYLSVNILANVNICQVNFTIHRRSCQISSNDERLRVLCVLLLTNQLYILVIKMYSSNISAGLRNIHEDDRNLLQESWSIVRRNIQKIGVNIFTMIFQQCPEAKFVWIFKFLFTICNF